MESVGASASDMSAIWAALQATDDGLTRGVAPAVETRSYAVAGFTDDAADEEEDDEEEEDDDDADADEMAPVMPPRFVSGGGGGGGSGSSGGLLPPSFYSATSSGLPDVVPTFLLSSHHRSYTNDAATTTHSAVSVAHHAASSSDMFLDDILHSQDEPFGGHGSGPLGSEHHAANARLTPERLSQLEDNYERKKKRAKINRRDLNSRFQELMDLLHLKEDRKLNRAKVLEKAIEQITKLSDELKTTKLQLQRQSQSQSQHHGSLQPLQPPPFHAGPSGALPMAMQLPLPPQWTSGVNMAATPMMWMPMLPSARPPSVSRPTSARSRSGANKAAKATTATTTTTVSMQTQTSPERPSASVASSSISTALGVRRPGLKRGRESVECVAVSPSSSSSSSSLVWIAQEVPALLELCDAWTLRELLGVSRELRTASRRDALWARLCKRRWRLDSIVPTAAQPTSRALWTQLDAANEMPHCFCVTGATLAFASGRRAGVALWAALVKRSNGRTTRTVLVDGKAVVRQVVELNVVVQNLDPSASLKLTNDLRVVGTRPSAFELLTGDLLAPHLVTVNDVPRGTTSVAGVELFHGDFCVLSVFVACDGLDLEQHFLERVDGVELQCERYAQRQKTQTLRVSARAHDDKHVRITDAYGSSVSYPDKRV